VLADAMDLHETTLLKRKLLIEKVKRTSPLKCAISSWWLWYAFI
jgi:hypothetical protein